MTLQEQLTAFFNLVLSDAIDRRVYEKPILTAIANLKETVLMTSAENLAKFQAFATKFNATLANVQADIELIKATISAGMSQADVDAAVTILDGLSAKFTALDEQNPATPPPVE